MTGLDRLHEIAEDVGRTVWLRDLGAALSETADAIDGGTRDPSGYESDALAWVEENGGLDAVRERLMPEGMEWLLDVWPKWSNGEYCKFGDWWKSGKYGETEPKQFRKLSIYTPEQLDEWGQGDGESFGYEWDFVRPSDSKYRPDKVEPPAPKVLDADGVEVRKGDTVWSTIGGTEYRVIGFENGLVHVENAGASFARAYFEPGNLTHQRPVLDADGVPIKVGDTVWHKGTGEKYRVFRFSAIENCVWGENDLGSFLLNCSMFAHTKPEPDSWSSVWADVSNGCETPQGMERRCKALAERCER